MTAWFVFAAAGLGTYLSRGVFILLVGDRVLSSKVERVVANIGPAVLAALTASLLTTDGLGAFLGSIPEVAAVVAGVIVGLWRRTFVTSFLVAIVVWAGLSVVV
ncbi:MAG TPA: AzlD domain-containing protein [Acidimicrobiia bacterium]|nr:AzlD domain-containing protein [Acidimicrobiia bacterium]